MKDNPQAALAALTSPAKLTLGKVALLCRLDAPVLAGDVSDIAETLAAIYIYEHPLAETVPLLTDIRTRALLAYENLSPADYREKALALCDALAAFVEMLPRPAPDAKKNSATAGAPSSPNGSVVPTVGRSSTSSKSSPPCKARFCGGAGYKGPAEAKPARSSKTN